MKITNQLQEEILAMMNDYWDSYFRGDLHHWEKYLVEDYRNIGGTEEEIWNSKKEILDYTHRMIDQMVGQADMRNKQSQIIPYDPYIMVHEYMDLFIKAQNEWNFYGKFRLSSLIQKINDEWKVLHQHGSYPDSHTEQGEAFAFNKLRKENTELRDAVKRRTIELELKNRDLQIEAAVEKVRLKAMSINHTSDFFEVNQELFSQLSQLEIPGLTGVSIYLVDENDIVKVWDLSSPGKVNEPNSYSLKYDAKKYPILGGWVDLWKSSIQDYFLLDFPKEVLINVVEEFKEVLPEMAVQFQNAIETGKLQHQWSPSGRLADGLLSIDLTKPPTEDIKSIVTKMAAAFNMAYQRFIDLQKAEAQARESQIQLALERVRSRSMAMHKSDELLEVATILADQLTQLDFKFDNVSFGENNQADDFKFWVATTGNEQPIQIHVPYLDNPAPKRVKEAQKKGVKFFADILSQEENRQWSQHLIDNSASLKALPGNIKNYILNSAGYARSTVILKDINIYIGNYKAIPYTEYENHLFQRFAQVFEQSYTRFLDLQKAEAQAKEAQIELGLERVRAKAMAMQHSDHLKDVIKVIGHQLHELELHFDYVNFVVGDTTDGLDTWNVSFGHTDPVQFFIPYTDNRTFNEMIRARKEGLGFNAYILTKEETFQFVTHLVTTGILKYLPEEQLQKRLQSKGMSVSTAVLNEVFLTMANYSAIPYTDQEKNILQRFGNAFQQAFTRFLDLQKAEAQAREAKIEMALEKIRSRTMAMQHSDELPDAANLLFLEVQALGIPAWSCGYNVLAEDKKTSDCWMSSEGAIQQPFNLYFTEEASFIEWFNFLKSNEDFYVQELGENRLKDHYNYMRNIPHIGEVLKKLEDAGISLPTYQINHLCKYTFGFLLFITYEPVPEAHDIFKRFTKVFEQTFTRFLDLQKAEAQARESKIEAALEKVRSRTMAMQQSTELGEVASVLFKEMNQLVTNLWTCGFVLCEKYRAEDEWWLSMDAGFTRGFFLPNVGDYAHATLYDGWQTGEAFRSVELHSQLLQEHYDWLMGINISRKIFEEMDAAGLERPEWQKLHAAYFSRGYLCIITREPSEGEDIFKRFAQVFDLTYTRFLDLQKAEAQAKEAQVELSLERIRSKVTAMRESSELLDIVVAMRNEFVALGHEAHYFWHMRWLPEKYEKAMTSGDGSRIGMVMQLPRHMHGDIKLLADWEKTNDPTVVFAMDTATAVDYIQKMITLGDFEIVDPNAPTLNDIRHIGGLTFIMARTTHGEIGYSLPGCVTDPRADGIATLSRFAGVFDLAYKRFEDLKAAERDLIAIKAARLKAEDALAVLQATQKQLIQSEKMASLGELTAGIAHEIQNPLNFVNNFSEVNFELIDELKTELTIGNVQEAIVIADDIKENEQKISHHGKRADAIVKGMLQHSRIDGGKKELTDINALADEYLRLSYHGLRAKDKTFNSVLETHFDPSIKPIYIVPQEIGRVLLNLLNNAFYAVHEKKKIADNDYEPTVSVSTVVHDHKVSIKIKDNGNGIPKKVVDKIFQPFFTTKPTGEGTGLGLSLSYDIVKAHGGELKVKTKEGEGAEFIITVSSN
jgi:signal transduction histidine kinase